MLKEDRTKAFKAAKSAVKAYAKDPSDRNAASVRSAWEVVNDHQATLIWRQKADMWLRSNAGPDDE